MLAVCNMYLDLCSTLILISLWRANKTDCRPPHLISFCNQVIVTSWICYRPQEINDVSTGHGYRILIPFPLWTLFIPSPVTKSQSQWPKSYFPKGIRKYRRINGIGVEPHDRSKLSDVSEQISDHNCSSKQLFFNKHQECKYNFKTWNWNLNKSVGKMNMTGLSGLINGENLYGIIQAGI